MSASLRVVALVLFSSIARTSAWDFDSDVISDLATPAADEGRALAIKAEKFWHPVLKAAEEVKLEEHLATYDDVENVIAELPAQNDHVRSLLVDALTRLKRADEKVLANAVLSADTASEGLTAKDQSGDMFSFLRGGQNFLALAVQRFVGGGRYSERLVKHIAQRQGEILPALQSAADAAGDVLTDCRLTSKLGFDVLKYDIYDSKAPKTPESAKKVAHQLIDASTQTRRSFMSVVLGAVGSITRDVEQKHDSPSATVTQTLLASALPPSTSSLGAAGLREPVLRKEPAIRLV
eukprot:TRINITY_DN62988_c0_g1_i1.p1 TRINITY_DN62988_c0_g1~~TRINITY_DN62988_c0_g1_i1.p1  ORF type:complete len:293 (+),score=88.12 TRINITY_DN62988_c0_g1_i1:91-969(+)